MTPSTFMLMDIPIANITMDEALQRIFDAAASYTPQSHSSHMHFVNAHCINTAAVNGDYRRVLIRADAVFPDGTGIRKAGTMLGVPVKDNVNGTDMFPLLCRRCAQTGKSIYLLGAKPGAAERAGRWAVEHAGKAIIAGCRDGYFSPEEQGQVIEEINSSRPDILLTAMGVPRQELWLDEHREKLQVPVCMGVGGLFDFYSGTIPRAPLWMRRMGIEWVWRLMMEPGRMWRRYIIGNAVFLMHIKKIQRNMRKEGGKQP